MAPVSLALFWHHHQPYYPDDVAGENPMPWVQAARDQRLPGHGASPRGSARVLVHDQPGAQPSGPDSGVCDGAERRSSRSSRRPADGLEEDDVCYLLDNFFMANPDTMIRPHPRYHELYMMRSVVGLPGQAGAAPVSTSRPARPSGLVEPGVDPPPAVRKRPRAGRVQEQGAVLHRGREAMASGQTARAGGAGDPAPSRAGRAGPDRADHDPLLPPHSAVAARQHAGARGHAGGGLAGAPRRLPRRRGRARPPRRREPHASFRRAAAWHVAQRGFGLPGT